MTSSKTMSEQTKETETPATVTVFDVRLRIM